VTVRSELAARDPAMAHSGKQPLNRGVFACERRNRKCSVAIFENKKIPGSIAVRELVLSSALA
jgi:hypothetical protein